MVNSSNAPYSPSYKQIVTEEFCNRSTKNSYIAFAIGTMGGILLIGIGLAVSQVALPAITALGLFIICAGVFISVPSAIPMTGMTIFKSGVVAYKIVNKLLKHLFEQKEII